MVLNLQILNESNSNIRRALFSNLCVQFCFRVGTKEGGSRFLTFVDSINGFKHLLTQEDLDKALSMCSSLRGKLRSRFLVLSDDRNPPPPLQIIGVRGHLMMSPRIILISVSLFHAQRPMRLEFLVLLQFLVDLNHHRVRQLEVPESGGG